MGKRRRSKGWHWKQRKPAPPPPPIILEEVMISDDGIVCKYDSESIPESKSVQEADVVTIDDEDEEEVTGVGSGNNDEDAEKEGGDDRQPNLAAMAILVKNHCLFCLKRKGKTILRMNDSGTAVEFDGFELVRQYIGPKTAECLNDIYDVMVFGNKGLLMAEFPAPFLCEECVRLVKELDGIHSELEVMQRRVLHKIKEIREIVLDNMLGENRPKSEHRRMFENDVLAECQGNEETAMDVSHVLEKFQDGLDEETRDPIEIHLEHLEQIRSFTKEDSLGNSTTVYVTVNETHSKETQTDDANEVIRYEVKIIKANNVVKQTNAKPINEESSMSQHSEAEEVIDLSSDMESEDMSADVEVVKGGPKLDDEVRVGKSLDNNDKDQPVVAIDGPCIQGSGAGASVLPAEEVPISSSANESTILDTSVSVTIQHRIAIAGVTNNSSNEEAVTLNTTSGEIPGVAIHERNRAEIIAANRSGDSSSIHEGNDHRTADEIESSDSEPPNKRRKESDEETVYVCSICKQEFESKGSIYKHIRLVHNREPQIPEKKTGSQYECVVPDCDRIYGRKLEVKAHMTNNHELSELEQRNLIELYRCDLCGFSKPWLSFMEFIQHLLDHEIDRKDSSCADCLQDFTTKQMYELHPCPQYGQLPGTCVVVNNSFGHLRTEFKCRLCPSCDDFLSENALLKHFESCHENESAFSCSHCKGEQVVTFRSRTSFHAHMIDVHGAVPFKCRICEDASKKFSCQDDLYIHLHAAHFGGDYNCPRCPRRFSTRQILDVHLVGHLPAKLFKCEFCGRELKNQVGLDRHIREVHAGKVHKIPIEDTGGNEESSIQGSRAYTVDNSSEVLKRNGQRKPYSCILCVFGSSKFNLYRVHMQLYHGVLLPRNQQTRTYTCQICGYFSNNSRLHGFLSHLSEHENADVKRFHCEDCLDSFTTQQMYQLHRCPQVGKLPGSATIHSQQALVKEKERPCRFCGDMFTSDKAMQDHTAEAHKQNAFPCEICIAAFKCRDTLASHMITAHDAVPYKCRVCQPTKIFKTQFEIFSHSNIEHFGRCHQCDVCSAKFLDKLSLADHMETHSTVRAYICSVCGASLKSRQTLCNHIRVYHKGRTRKVPCEFCGKEFIASNIHKHIKTVHADESTKLPNNSRSEVQSPQVSSPSGSSPQRPRSSRNAPVRKT